MGADDLLAKIHVASCCKVQSRKAQWAWRSIADANPDLTVLLGDNVYTKSWSHQYLRDRYVEQGNITQFKYFKENCFYLATWDDHDLGPNNAKGGTPEAQENGETGIARRDEARNLFQTFMAPKVPNPADLTTVPGEIYCSYRLGSVLIIVLDGRYYREDVAVGPAAEFLGPDQEAWLWDQFDTAQRDQVTATIVCCGSTISSSDQRSESLKQYTAFYERFQSRFRQCPNPIYLSGDIHENRMRVHDGFVEIVSSGVAQRRRRSAISAFLSGSTHKNLNNRAILYIHESHLRVTMHGSDKGDEVFDFPLKDHLDDKRHLNNRTWRDSDS